MQFWRQKMATLCNRKMTTANRGFMRLLNFNMWSINSITTLTLTLRRIWRAMLCKLPLMIPLRFPPWYKFCITVLPLSKWRVGRGSFPPSKECKKILMKLCSRGQQRSMAWEVMAAAVFTADKHYRQLCWYRIKHPKAIVAKQKYLLQPRKRSPKSEMCLYVCVWGLW